MVEGCERPFELYKILEISHGADSAEITAAFRRLAKQFHPDKENGDAAKFLRIQEAYEVLSDKERRAKYDADCQGRMVSQAERAYREAERERRSAVYKYKNPLNIKESLMQRIKESLAKNFESMLSESILQKILQDVNALVPTIREKFKKHPFGNELKKLEKVEREFASGKTNSTQIKKNISDYGKDFPEIDTSFWSDKLKPLLLAKSQKTKGLEIAEFRNNPNAEILQNLQRQLLESWRESYEKRLLRWMMETVEKSCLELEAKYLGYLRSLQTIRRILGYMPSFGWNLSLADLQSQDIQEIIRYGKFLEDNPKIKELCELMGRMQKAVEKIERIRIRETIAYERVRKDFNSREEISGVTFSDRIEDALPQELALLSDKDTSILFDLKFIEKRLLSFERMGYVSETKSKTVEKEIEKKEKGKEKGPIIICVDTSSSMAGSPENVAKAVTLCLAGMAHAQDRNCYLINFSTAIETLDFCLSKGMKDLIAFLEGSFHGGTDVMPALQEGLKMMDEGGYKNSDLLVISDLMFPVNDETTLSRMAQRREKKNRFYALTISDCFDCPEESLQIFDAAWTCSPKSFDVQKLSSNLFDIGRAASCSKD